MDPDNAFLIICLGIVGAIGIPAALYFSLRRGHEANAINLMRHAAGRARHPWEDEDESLAELSRRVASLKESQQTREDPQTRREDSKDEE
jgi:hypothetical protein